jgi:hypothetical protein
MRGVKMNQLFNILEKNLGATVLGIIFLVFIMLILLIGINVKVNKMMKKYKKFMDGISPVGVNIEEMLIEHVKRVNSVAERSKELENIISDLNIRANVAIQQIGIKRYSAFEDVGSDLSYSIALLDNSDTGVVITGIFSRESSTTFAKPIVDGESKYILSVEETEAIANAKKEYLERQGKIKK